MDPQIIPLDIAGAGSNIFVGFLSGLVYSAGWFGWCVGLQPVLDPHAGDETAVFTGNALRVGSGRRPVGGKVHIDQSGLVAGAVVCTRRGLFSLGPVTIHTGDPFGLFRARLEFSGKRSVLVTPPIVSLPEVEIAPGGRAGEGSARTYAQEPTVSAAGIREYRPEDTLRHIHWPTSARKGSYFVRLFDRAPASDWFILLDLENEVQRGEGFFSTEEHGVILAASLSDLGLRAGIAVGLGINGDHFSLQPPSFGEAQRHNIMRALALASTGKVPLDKLLEKGRSLIHNNTSLIVITADSQGSWLERLLLLMERGIIPTVMLIDADTYLKPENAQQDHPRGAQQHVHSNHAGVSPSVQLLLARLEAHGIVHYRFPRSFLDQPEARPGKQGRWQWTKASGDQGGVKEGPGDLSWRDLE